MKETRDDLGQHLLRDERAIARLLAAAQVRQGDVVLDAGAGAGAITRPLAEAVGPTGRVMAVEIDERMIAALRADLPANVDVVHADLLTLDLPRNLSAIVANPPFKILAPFIERIAAARVPRAALLVPLELAERLTAPPGSERYGPLTIRVGVVADVAFVARVSRRAFRPAPTVDCAIVALRSREEAAAPAAATLAAVIEAAMAARERKAKYAFALLPDAFRMDSAVFQRLLAERGLSESRAGELSPAAFAAIARLLDENAQGPAP